MLTEICQYLRNWFVREKHTGTYVIAGGSLDVDFLQNNQYFRVVGSVFNDGVHKYGDNTDVLNDETFTGEVWGLAIPKEIVSLANDIKEWVTVNKDVLGSPYMMESFGGYSYSFGVSGNSASGSVSKASWQSQFAARLAPWRKI